VIVPNIFGVKLTIQDWQYIAIVIFSIFDLTSSSVGILTKEKNDKVRLL
jgi:hypothetical protein